MERIKRNRNLFVTDGLFTVSAVGKICVFPKALGNWIVNLWRSNWHRLETAIGGWGDDEITAFWEKIGKKRKKSG